MLIDNNTGRPVYFEGNETAIKRAANWIGATIHKSPDCLLRCERGMGYPINRAQSELGNTTGGFVVPDELSGEVIALRNLVGVLRREARTVTMGSDHISVPRRTAGATAVFVGENTAISETNLAWDQVALTAKKVGLLSRVSTELSEDSAVALVEYFIEEFAHAIASVEDDCGFNGDGTSAYGGMIGLTKLAIDGAHAAGKVTAASGHDTFDELDASDLSAVMAALPEQHFENASWYISAYGMARSFGRLGMSSAGFRQTPNGRRPIMTYAGFPIVTTPKLPGSGDQSGKVMLAFGDLRNAAVIGSRTTMELRSSGARYMDTDQIGYRATVRFDVNCANIGDNTNAGALVFLVGE